MLSINPLKYYLCLDNRQTACKAIDRSLLHSMDVVLFCSEHKLTIFISSCTMSYVLEGYFYSFMYIEVGLKCTKWDWAQIIVQSKLPIKWHMVLHSSVHHMSYAGCNIKKLWHGTPEKCDLSSYDTVTSWPLTHCLSSPSGAVRGAAPGAAFISPTCV